MSRIEPVDIRHSQNFLTSRRLVDALLDRSTIGVDDLVVEIGAGRGIITERLVCRSRRVIAFEKDPTLAARLGRRFGGTPNVDIRRADFLAAPLPRVPYKVFANIPFSATTEIITRLTAADCPPDDAYLVVQAEAAARFSGCPRESLVSVLLKPWFEPSIVHRFRRSDFAPAPRVDVVMLRLRKRGPPLVGHPDAQLFRDLVVHGFVARGPSLGRTLERLFGRRRARQLEQHVGLARAATPSGVSFERWLDLFHALDAADRARVAQRLAGAEWRLRRLHDGLPKLHRTRLARTRRPPPSCRGSVLAGRAGRERDFVLPA
jgi:23S rRNA (adenine-N6)-dimethyltransferase